MSERLTFDFPNASLAILAFDLQVPAELVLALELSGIKTAAVNERPLTLVIDSQPFAVSHLLTASPFFSRAALASCSVAVEHVQAVGMWRTDLIHESRCEGPPEVWKQARDKGLKLAVALPSHALDNHYFQGNPLATSPAVLAHFIGGLVDLAIAQPGLMIVVRGKNADWMRLPQLAGTVARVSSVPNIMVSVDYERPNEAYRLVAWADVVVAKYTSLVDEALAVDTPCVVHDFSMNSRGFSRSIVPFLPDELWASDEVELETRVLWALSKDGAVFREWWTPRRRFLYGDLNDGSVRERARNYLTALAEPSL